MDDRPIPRKRRRPTASCVRCREKKVRCDRMMPACDNCIRAASKCAYRQFVPDLSPELPTPEPRQKRTRPAEGGKANGHEIPRGVGIVEDLQARVNKLEDTLAANGLLDRRTINESRTSLQPVDTIHLTTSPRRLGTLVVKGSRSRYHGQNERATLLNQFTELKGFVTRAADDHAITQLAKEVQLLQVRAHWQFRDQASSFNGYSPALFKLRESLPTKSICDRLLETYIENFEKTLRILHLPTFRRLYTDYWTRENQPVDTLPAFLPQLTSILAISRVLDDRYSQTGDLSARTYLKQAALDLVEAWLNELGRKERSELSTLQVETLLLLAKQLRIDHAEKLWMMAGALVRSAMAIGLHLDPSRSDKISFYQAENRRRLWITIVEMDIQASIASGMPLMAPECDYSSLTPNNIHDSDYDETTKELPPFRPLTETTDSLSQIALATSMPQRIRILSLMQDTTVSKSLDEVIKEGSHLEELLKSIPPPLRLSNNKDPHCSAGDFLNRVLLDVLMRRMLITLYRPFLVSEHQLDPSFDRIRSKCLESALAILSYQDYFDPEVADLDAFALTSLYWNIFQIFCRDDIRWAALGVCQYIKTFTQSVPTPATDGTSPASGRHLAITQTPNGCAADSIPTKGSLIRLVENTIDGLIRSVVLPGSSLKDIAFLVVLLRLVRGARSSGEQKEKLMYEDSKKVLVACRQILTQQLAVESGERNGENNGDTGNDLGRRKEGMEGAMAASTELPEQWPALGDELDNFQGDIFGIDDDDAFGFDFGL